MKKKTKYLILILSIVAVLVLIACGFLGVHLYHKSQVESAVYRKQEGRMPCFACGQSMKCCPHSKDPYGSGVYNPTAYKLVFHNITKVSAKSGMVKDVWIVTIESDCPGGCFDGHWHNKGVLRWVDEYSYVNGNLKLIRAISHLVDLGWGESYKPFVTGR